jgi:hypothetical protein
MSGGTYTVELKDRKIVVTSQDLEHFRALYISLAPGYRGRTAPGSDGGRSPVRTFQYIESQPSMSLWNADMRIRRPGLGRAVNLHC